MSTKELVPAEMPLPWDRNEGDIFIEEPMKQLLMVRGWGWMSKEYGEKRAEEIQDKILDFTLSAVNHHQELVTRLYNLVNAVETTMSLLNCSAEVNMATHESRETLKKVIQ